MISSKEIHLKSKEVWYVNLKVVKANNYSFERAQNSKYLGSVVTDHNIIDAEIRAKLTTAHSFYF